MALTMIAVVRIDMPGMLFAWHTSGWTESVKLGYDPALFRAFVVPRETVSPGDPIDTTDSEELVLTGGDV